MPKVLNKYEGTKEYYLTYSELITAARYRGTVTYQEIAQIIGLPTQGSNMGTILGRILGEISENETNNGRPMLSAVAVSVQGEPGSGFFDLARYLKKLKGTSESSEYDFWEDEREAVYETWKVILKS